MTFEELLEDAGGFGLYQKLLAFVFLLGAMSTAGLNYWTQIFILLEPEHNCSLPDANNSLDVINRDSCHLYIRPNDTNLNETVKVRCNSGWDYDYNELFPTMTSEQNWVCEENWRVYLTHMAFWIGSVVGFFISGIISDRFGRRRTIIILELVSIVSNVLSIFMTNHLTFSAARFLTGLTVLTSSTLAFLLTIEYTGVSQRTMIGMLQGVGWTITAAVSPWILYYVRNWRKMLFICSVPNVLMIFMLWWVPESASWLLTRGKKDEAIKILNRISAVNKRKLDKDHFKRILSRKNSHEKKEEEDSKEIFSLIIKVIRTKYLRKNLFLLLILWFFVSLCYNGNTLETINLHFNVYLAFSIGAIVELAANVFFFVTAEKFGRRWANFISNIVGTVAAISTLALPKEQGLLEFICVMVLRFAYAWSYDVTLQYGTELLPTAIRGRGVAVQLMIGDIGNCISPCIVYLNYFNAHYPLLVFGTLSIGSAIIALVLPETADQPLPQTIEDGSKFGIGQPFFLCPFLEKRKKKKMESLEWREMKTKTISTTERSLHM
ncbi:organic cation transporter 1-like [Centruroides sculpturatus]|uniref:organic cation transporter 1-like n=1 Tax=Centruroides sculpturatus TaxID=218467 RepID=UPI000C6DC167|nr:organic cation transporter 1-like [Centruroides sculpturatus]